MQSLHMILGKNNMDLFQADKKLTERLMKNHTKNHEIFDGTEIQANIGKELQSMGLSGNCLQLDMFRSPSIGDYSFFVTKNNLIKINENVNDFYKTNSYGYRCDSFTKEHDGTHILFAGCSVTFGEGLPENFLWAKKLYNKISETTKTSGYFNIGRPGSSITDIVGLVKAYQNRYGTPDYIFILFPDPDRDGYAGIELAANLKNAIDSKIYATTWDCRFAKNSKYTVPNRETFDAISYFKKIDYELFLEHLYKYQKSFSGKYKPYVLKGLDDAHPGIAENDFYANIFYRRWQECKGII